jgi:hypothetical protein
MADPFPVACFNNERLHEASGERALRETGGVYAAQETATAATRSKLGTYETRPC